MENSNENASGIVPISIRILDACIKLKLKFFYLIAIFATVSFFIQFSFVATISDAPHLSYSLPFLLILFVLLIYIIVFFDNRALFYFKKKIKRARTLIFISSVLSLILLSFLISEIPGDILDNDYLRFFPYFLLPIPFLGPILIKILSAVALVTILILLLIVLIPSFKFKYYLDSPISYKNKIDLGASGYWMSEAAEYGAYIFLVILFIVPAIDLSGASCLGVARNQVGCFANKAVVNNDVSICENIQL